MDETPDRDIDLTAAPNSAGAPVAMLLADLGRWLTELDERLSRLEANAFPLASRLGGAHGGSFTTDRMGATN